MATDLHDESEVKERLWKEIAKTRIGMLGLVGMIPAQHFQPMTAFAEPEESCIWFFTRTDTELAQSVIRGAEAMFIIETKDRDVYACLGGRLRQQEDHDRLEKYWSPVVAAWYPNGKDDPLLTMLRLDVRDAQVWINQAGPIKFAYEIAKANMSGETPDLGGSAHVAFNGGDRA